MGLFRKLMGRLSGHNALSTRIDILQNKLDALNAPVDEANASIAVIQKEIRNLPTKKVLGLIGHNLPVIAKGHPFDLAAQVQGGKKKQNSADGPVIDRIGFLVHSVELVNHYGCVWDLLPEGSFDVLLHGEATKSDISLLSRWKCMVTSTGEVLDSKTKYRYLVSNHPVSLGDKPLINALAETNIRFMYAAGKSGWNLSDWNNLYDLILCFGPYHAKAFSTCSDAVILQMGYPRLDRYFNTRPGRDELQARFGCDPSKKTVVWLPTWKTLSSVGLFDQEVSSLTELYNVVVKLHPLMPESEPERVEALRKFSFTHLIADASDNLPLYQLADYMLFDYGGPPLAGIYVDKMFVLLNVPGAESDALTGSDSPDIQIRQHLVSVDAKDGTIARLLADEALWEEQRPVRHMLRKEYFAPHFGFSSDIAARALLNLDNIFPEWD